MSKEYIVNEASAQAFRAVVFNLGYAKTSYGVRELKKLFYAEH
jgi:hypothetical protein